MFDSYIKKKNQDFFMKGLKRSYSSYKGKTKAKGFKKRKQDVITKLVGRSSIIEIKCRDQIFSPGAAIALTALASLAYVAPTVGGLGLATGYTAVNLLSVGTYPGQRIGSNVCIKSLRVQGDISLADNADITDNGSFRIMLVYDKQTNGAAPAYTDIIADIDGDGTYGTTMYSGVKIANRKRYVVLRDQVKQLSFGSGPGTHHIDWFIKKSLDVEYKAIQSAIASVSTGAIYLLIFTTGAQFTHAPILNDFVVRMRYKD